MSTLAHHRRSLEVESKPRWPHKHLGSAMTVILFIATLCIINQVPKAQCLLQQVGSSSQPTFIKNMDLLTVRENTPIGEIVYTLEAVSDRQQQTQMIYGIEGTHLFSVDKLSGQVRVAQLIDREQTSDTITFQVTATAINTTGLLNLAPRLQSGPTTQLTITVLIVDENDNPPRIERVKVGRSEYDALALGRQLFNTQTGISLGPVRTPIIRLNVSESLPLSSVIVDLIEALDVDKASTSPLKSICLDCSPEFTLQSPTDNLLNDRINSSIILISPLVHVPRNNIRQLNVVVTDGKFNSSIIFEITIDDVQNRPPQFIGSTTCIVQENIPIDKTIITIQAIDGDAIGIDDVPSSLTKSNFLLGRQLLYDLVGQDEQSSVLYENFKLNPITGQLQIANRLNREAYLASNGVLSLRVRARELTVKSDTIIRSDDRYDLILERLTPFVDASPESVSEVEITVIVIDVNDNEPHWLNAKEIAALNINQSPDWYNNLPNDQDTGRVYQIRVKENSIAGAPVTTKNEMFVYDLDSGENSKFNISLIDPFNLFDVEPKEATGFAHVTLKMASTQRRKPLLDYENPNERSFIIQLIATEIDTPEHYSSKAQVQIDIVDVNDNSPEFKEPTYYANIREDAPFGKTVLSVQATDKDEVSKQLSYSLHGKTAYLFDINRYSGLITVARCDASQTIRTRRHCLDYEHQKMHPLIVEVSDGEFSTKVPLTIFIEDVSDNAPVFNLPVVDVVIEEGSDRLEPPIRIEATDIDQTSVLSYSIVDGNFEGLFSINNSTSELQLTRPIRINHDDHLSGGEQQQLNKITLTVQATDGVFKTNSTIRIDVLDANDNAPKFLRNQYSAEIHESASPGQVVVAVRAIDSDRGNNARVSYKIQRGSYGLFNIDDTTGVITVSKLARGFNTSQRENYTLEVIAYDHGLISKSSAITVSIHILDTIKEAPKFDPPIQRTNVSETTLNNTIIHRMTVLESASINNLMLIFEPGPIEALDKNGQPVFSSERLESMFSVSTNTGDVMVNSDLDHDFASHINLTIYVSNRQQPIIANGSELAIEEFNPRSVGYLIINVVDDNSNNPIFAAPWSPQQPELSYQMFEELPIGSVLAQLVASDVDSKISHFKIDPPNEYFELTSPQSGVIVNKKLIDYDSLMSQTFLKPGSHRSQGLANFSLMSGTNNIIQFNVYVFDSGSPQLSAKATVSVEILPLNDWDCKFEQSIYEVRLKENSPADTFVVQVRANDLDHGEQHNSIKYQLIGDLNDYFNIDSRTGFVTISDRGSVHLDRERLNKSTFTLTVLGHDEQLLNQGSVGIKQKIGQNTRTCSASIKVHIDDVNDNPPLFSQKLYEVTAYDTDVIDVPLVKLLVRDDDATTANNFSSPSQRSSVQSINHYKIISGNINDIFNVTSTGVIYVTKAMNVTQLSMNGPIQLRVQVKQQSLNLVSGVSTSFTDECIVRINMVKINRYGPEWRLESQNQISVLENARPGTLVTKLRCVDKDLQDVKYNNRLLEEETNRSNDKRTSASPIRYWIKDNTTNVMETKEFKIDPITGNLFTRIELDREAKEYYQLVVTCEDNGKPLSLESVLPIYITVLDVDDNKPEFVVSVDQGQSKHKGRLSVNFSVEEHQSKGVPVGELKAIDRDADSPTRISYCLLEGNEFQEFSLDRETGILYTNQTLDREKQSTYDLLIKAINDGSSCNEHMISGPFGGKDMNANKTSDRASSPKSNLPHQTIDHVDKRRMTNEASFLSVRIEVLDINDNAPVFKKQIHRAGAHHRSLMNTLVTQVAAFDPDSELNGTLSYKISEILMYKTTPNQLQSSRKYDVSNEEQPLSKPIKLIQFPFRIDQQGHIYTQQLLTQYQLMSMFVIHIEATEQAEPWRTARTKLEIYVYETGSQLKIKINLHPRIVEAYRSEIETLLSNATKYTAIINRARSYYGTVDNQDSSRSKSSNPQSVRLSQLPTQSLTIASSVNQAIDEPSYSNIHLIFVDNHRIVNPNLVMEKFDLTSAQLFMPQMLNQLTDFNNNLDDQASQRSNLGEQHQRSQINELSSLIDKVALASVQASEYHANPSTLAGIDWLESPPILYLTITAILAILGFIVFLFGCCCTSRIKDHIIKVAMDKLVKQQNLQAKINDQMLAATNQVAMNGNNRQNGQDYLMHQGGFMSSFDTTKGCITNNNENMNILQRAMESGEFIDPNYTTLNGQVNMGAHYYDTSELDQQRVDSNFTGDVGPNKRLNDPNDSGSIGDEIREENSDLMSGHYPKKSKLLSNGTSNQLNPRNQRQQMPNGG